MIKIFYALSFFLFLLRTSCSQPVSHTGSGTNIIAKCCDKLKQKTCSSHTTLIYSEEDDPGYQTINTNDTPLPIYTWDVKRMLW